MQEKNGVSSPKSQIWLKTSFLTQFGSEWWKSKMKVPFLQISGDFETR